jgi:hypothetical protein
MTREGSPAVYRGAETNDGSSEIYARTRVGVYFLFSAPPSKVETIACMKPSCVM